MLFSLRKGEKRVVSCHQVLTMRLVYQKEGRRRRYKVEGKHTHSGHRHRHKMVILLKNIWHRGGREFSEALGQNGNMSPLPVGQA